MRLALSFDRNAVCGGFNRTIQLFLDHEFYALSSAAFTKAIVD